MGNIHTVGPNEALIVSGGCCGSRAKKTRVGGWAWAWWLVTDVQRLSLEVMTLNPVCESVETAQGVPLTVTGVAQVKIMKNADLLQTASEQFLGKKEHEIKSTVLQTLETLAMSSVMPTLVQFGLTVTMSAAVIAKGKQSSGMVIGPHGSNSSRLGVPGGGKGEGGISRSHSTPSLTHLSASSKSRHQKSTSNYCLNCRSKM